MARLTAETRRIFYFRALTEGEPAAPRRAAPRGRLNVLLRAQTRTSLTAGSPGDCCWSARFFPHASRPPFFEARLPSAAETIIPYNLALCFLFPFFSFFSFHVVEHG